MGLAIFSEACLINAALQNRNGVGATMKQPKIRAINEQERRALVWARSSYRNKLRARMLEERMRPSKGYWFNPVWEHRPFGYVHMNRDFQWARLAVRRATYFRDLPCYAAGR